MIWKKCCGRNESVYVCQVESWKESPYFRGFPSAAIICLTGSCSQRQHEELLQNSNLSYRWNRQTQATDNQSKGKGFYCDTSPWAAPAGCFSPLLKWISYQISFSLIFCQQCCQHLDALLSCLSYSEKRRDISKWEYLCLSQNWLVS